MSTAETAAHCAGESGDSSMLWLLWGRRAPLYGVDRQGRTVAHVAATAGNYKSMFMVSQWDMSMRSAAPKNRPPGVFEGKLINQRAFDSVGDAPVHTAARNGGLESLKALVMERADVQLPNRQGRTAEEVAANEPCRELLQRAAAVAGASALSPSVVQTADREAEAMSITT